ncbi:LysR family substrate-binding domain-containing protein [Acidomonas methanolica]|uniref:LysR family substrate-binding domain-containing protein n=1 Tax=Acidomonas methanolica TaxID=437 RepID=UPI00211A02CB|nr:LysR family substrate-binding domain-containing protein [Acidomonas methanolica]
MLPPIGKRFQKMLSDWRKKYPDIRIVFHELGDESLRAALFRRHVDVIFFAPDQEPDAVESLPFYSENLLLALSSTHSLRDRESLTRHELRNETFLLQDWGHDYSIKSRYIDILGKDVTFESHPAGKQSVFALVSAGYGVTLAVQSQAERGFPGVIFRPFRGDTPQLPIRLGWDANREDPIAGRFVAFIRDFVREH